MVSSSCLSHRTLLSSRSILVLVVINTSSRHLLGTGREDEARNVIATLNSVDIDDELVDEVVGELLFAIHAENDGGKATWWECFSTRNSLWKRTLNGMMLMFIQQLNGQNFYCEPILRTHRLSFSNLLDQITMDLSSSRVLELGAPFSSRKHPS